MTYVTSSLMGGLGNYLFQIAAGYSYALQQGKKYYIDLRHVQTGHRPIQEYKENILRNFTFIENSDIHYVYQEPHFHYTPINLNVASNVHLYGYFQCEKYFVSNADTIRQLLSVDSNTKNVLHQKYENILKLPNCSIHVRRGDYLNKQNVHPVQSVEYYKKAISSLREDVHYLIFSDDINWCKNNFNFVKNKTYIENNKDYQDLYLMSLCNNNIIANSSFSWWGAWLNDNPSKIIIAPENWFGINYSASSKDLYIKNWIKI